MEHETNTILCALSATPQPTSNVIPMPLPSKRRKIMFIETDMADVGVNIISHHGDGDVLEQNKCISRNGEHEILEEETIGTIVKVVEPHTPSPVKEKQKQAKGSKTNIDLIIDEESSLKSPSRKRKILQKIGSKVEREITIAWTKLLSSPERLMKDDKIVCPEVLFICNVERIIGTRVFKPWKGSVLDSIIGTLLTQRVDDNTSSSAFIYLGMAYPQSLECDFYTMHHRILRKKRSNACYSSNSMACKESVPKLAKLQPDWKRLREACIGDEILQRDDYNIDYVDWQAVMSAKPKDISKVIKKRGMEEKMAIRIKDCLEELVSKLGNLDLEWLRYVETEYAKMYLRSIHGFGLKSVECVRLLTLRQRAFPVDINVARVTVRLGWVPAPSINDEILMCLLEQSSKLHDLIHGYLWPRLSEMDEEFLYQLHCNMITFGKIFCTKQKPNCGECPMRSECKHYNSHQVDRASSSSQVMDIMDIEDFGQRIASKSKPGMSIKESKRNKVVIEGLPKVISTKDKEQDVNKTTTEHLIFELPDCHPILRTFVERDPADLSPYLLLTWETHLEVDKASPSTSRVKRPREVPGTIMIPYRTALRGRFPLNATYFQPNEVFADLKTSQVPINVPSETLKGLPQKTLYCGVNLAGIAKGRSSNYMREFFNKGYMCTRSFDTVTRATKPLDGRLHKSSTSRKINLKKRMLKSLE